MQFEQKSVSLYHCIFQTTLNELSFKLKENKGREQFKKKQLEFS